MCINYSDSCYYSYHNNRWLTWYDLVLGTCYWIEAETLASASVLLIVLLVLLPSFEVSEAKRGSSILWNMAKDNAKFATLATPVHLLCAGLLGFTDRKMCLNKTVTWWATALWSRSRWLSSFKAESSTYTVMLVSCQFENPTSLSDAENSNNDFS